MNPIIVKLPGKRYFVCEECGRKQLDDYQCKKCGNTVFSQFEEKPEEVSDLETFEVLNNIIIGAQHFDKGTLIKLPQSNRITRDLSERNLIKVTTKKKSKIKGIRLKRSITKEDIARNQKNINKIPLQKKLLKTREGAREVANLERI